MRGLINHPFLRYCVVGGFGFAADWSVLQACVRFGGMTPVTGRVVSVVVALTATWLLHRWFTFAATGRANLLEWFRYMLANAVGALVNFFIYTALVHLWPEVGLTVPLAIASIMALLVNYLGAALFVFRKNRTV